jgi:hypothetical protein
MQGAHACHVATPWTVCGSVYGVGLCLWSLCTRHRITTACDDVQSMRHISPHLRGDDRIAMPYAVMTPAGSCRQR